MKREGALIGVRDIKIRGTKFDWEWFEKLKSSWKKAPKWLLYCPRHKIYFNPDEEPCWQCYDECKEVLNRTIRRRKEI